MISPPFCAVVHPYPNSWPGFCSVGEDSWMSPAILPQGWRTKKIADDPNVYEWWYFDIHNHDGTIVTGMLSPQTAIGRVPRFGTPQAMSRFDVNRNDVQSTAVETFPIDQFTSAGNSCDVRTYRGSR